MGYFLYNPNVISIRVKEPKSIIEKTFGLLLYKKPVPLLFHTRFGIHTFFLRYKIDVIVLNNSNKVVKIKSSMSPNTLFFWNPKYGKVLELPERTVKKMNITPQTAIRLRLKD